MGITLKGFHAYQDSIRIDDSLKVIEQEQFVQDSLKVVDSKRVGAQDPGLVMQRDRQALKRGKRDTSRNSLAKLAEYENQFFDTISDLYALSNQRVGGFSTVRGMPSVKSGRNDILQSVGAHYVKHNTGDSIHTMRHVWPGIGRGRIFRGTNTADLIKDLKYWDNLVAQMANRAMKDTYTSDWGSVPFIGLLVRRDGKEHTNADMQKNYKYGQRVIAEWEQYKEEIIRNHKLGMSLDQLNDYGKANKNAVNIDTAEMEYLESYFWESRDVNFSKMAAFSELTGIPVEQTFNAAHAQVGAEAQDIYNSKYYMDKVKKVVPGSSIDNEDYDLFNQEIKDAHYQKSKFNPDGSIKEDPYSKDYIKTAPVLDPLSSLEGKEQYNQELQELNKSIKNQNLASALDKLGDKDTTKAGNTIMSDYGRII